MCKKISSAIFCYKNLYNIQSTFPACSLIGPRPAGDGAWWWRWRRPRRWPPRTRCRGRGWCPRPQWPTCTPARTPHCPGRSSRPRTSPSTWSTLSQSVRVLGCRQYLAVAESWEGLVSPSTSSRNMAPADLKRRSAASRPERGLTRWRGWPEDGRTELSHCWVRLSCRRSAGGRRGQCWSAAGGPLTGRAWWVCPPSGRRWSLRTGGPAWCSPAWRWSNTHPEELLSLHPLAPLLQPQGLPLVPGAQSREPASTLSYMSGESHGTSQVESTSPGPKQ